MDKRIKYICYYDRLNAEVKRNYVLAAVNKLDYMFSALNANDIGVDIISVSECVETKWLYDGNHKLNIGMNTLRLFASFGKRDNAICRVLNRWFITIQFFIWLLTHLKRNEQVIVYHSLGYVKILLLARKIKHFRIIGEIEEIYQDVKSYTPSVCRAEYDFIHNCEKYIFPTSLLDKKLNQFGRPHLIIHGTYKAENDRSERFDDDKVHVVYAGTFDPNKGGASAAIASVVYLTSNYHVHILGFGNKRDTEEILKKIEEVSAISKCTITYDGLLKGEDYIRFIQKCHIGLSTQNPEAAFNATSFPSKILSYMANGLRVVSIRIEVVECSAVSKYVSYYNNQTPEEISQAIMNVDINNEINSRNIISELDIQFKKQLSNFFDFE